MQFDKFLVGNRIRKIRTEKNMTITELAEKANCSECHLNMIELGSRKFSFELMFAIMTALDTDANTLLGVDTENRSEIDESLNRFTGAQKEFFRTSFIHFLDSYPLAKEVG